MSAVVRQGPWMSTSALPSFRGILHPQDATPDDGEATMRRHKHRRVQFLALAVAVLPLLAASSGASAAERRPTGGGVCRDAKCPCTSETESKLEQAILKEMKIRREIWNSGQQDLDDGQKEAKKAIEPAIDESHRMPSRSRSCTDYCTRSRPERPLPFSSWKWSISR